MATGRAYEEPLVMRENPAYVGLERTPSNGTQQGGDDMRRSPAYESASEPRLPAEYAYPEVERRPPGSDATYASVDHVPEPSHSQLPGVLPSRLATNTAYDAQDTVTETPADISVLPGSYSVAVSSPAAQEDAYA